MGMKQLALSSVCAAFLLAIPQAHATSDSFSDQTLVGWSDDGTTFAVLDAGMMASATLQVYRRGKLVFEICNAAPPSEEAQKAGMEQAECQKGRNKLVVRIASRKKLSGLARINVESFKALKRFKLKAVQSAWRVSFKQAYKLKHGPYAEKPYGTGNCSHGWTLIRRSDNKRIKRVSVASGCRKTKGGYLSTNAKYALIKTDEVQTSPHYGGRHYANRYVLVKL